MSDTKVSALTAASTPLDEDWLLALAKGTPDDLDRRATLANVRGAAGYGIERSAGVWSAMSPLGDPNAVVFESDFLSSTFGLINYTSDSTGSGVTVAGNELGGTGVVSLNTGTTTTGRGGFIYPSGNPAANNAIQFGSGPAAFRAIVRLQALSDGTDTYSARIGFTRDPASSTPVDGLFFEYAPATRGNGNWWCVSRNGNSNRAEDTGVAASATVFQRLEIFVNANATEVTSFIDGTLEDTNTTNIPSGSVRRTGYGAAILKSAGTTGRSFYVDWMQVRLLFPSGRP